MTTCIKIKISVELWGVKSKFWLVNMTIAHCKVLSNPPHGKFLLQAWNWQICHTLNRKGAYIFSSLFSAKCPLFIYINKYFLKLYHIHTYIVSCWPQKYIVNYIYYICCLWLFYNTTVIHYVYIHKAL
jgi:hypothetical protein